MATAQIPRAQKILTRTLLPPAILFLLLSIPCGLAAQPAEKAGEKPDRLDTESFRKAVQGLLADRDTAPATVAVKIVSLPDGAEIFSHKTDRALNPASNIKLATTAAALAKLGKDYRFVTRFFVTALPDESGVVKGNLIVKGGGDPNISGRFHKTPTALFKQVADDLLELGVRRVTGDIVLDDTMFDRQYVHPDWPRGELQEWYCAGVAALSFNDNCVEVAVAPGKKKGERATVTVTPKNDYVSVTNHCTTTDKKKYHSVRVTRSRTKNQITVSGKFYIKAKPYRTDIAVHRPPLYFGAIFKDVLERKGIRIDGKTRLAKRSLDIEKDKPVEAAKLESPLLQTLQIANRRSQNFYAEQLFKTLGYEEHGEGTFRNGAKAVTAFLEETGIEDKKLVVSDGSGLSRKNRLTAGAVAELLAAMFDEEYRDEFLETLSVAGKNGSARSRLKEEPYAGRLFVKTGTMRGVSALSGYAKNIDGKWFAFAIISNGFPAGKVKKHKELEDEICRLIVRLKN